MNNTNHELTIDDLPKLTISEPGGRVAKGPTICSKCKNCIREIPSSRAGIATLLPSDVWYKCMVPAFDYVSGEKGYCHCIIKNHGNCPDYEPVRG